MMPGAFPSAAATYAALLDHIDGLTNLHPSDFAALLSGLMARRQQREVREGVDSGTVTVHQSLEQRGNRRVAYPILGTKRGLQWHPCSCIPG